MRFPCIGEHGKGVAVVTSKRDQKRPVVLALNSWRSPLLWAAVAATSLSLAACDSPVNESSKKAHQASDRAARVTQSAGEMRPKKEFAEQFAKKTDAEQEAKIKEIVTRIRNDAGNTAGVYKQYFDQKTVAQDLKRATDMLEETLKQPEFTNPGIKGALQEQLGTTAIQQAHVQMGELEEKLAKLVTMAIDIQSSAAYINGLGIEADVQEKRAAGLAGQEKSGVNVDEAKAAAAKGQEVVTDLEKQIADLTAKRDKIYADTDAAMQQAEQLNGTAAIEQSKKAVEQRKQAEDLNADIANLQPTLARAKADLVTLQLQQQEAEARQAAATASAKESADAAEMATNRAAALRKQAKDLIEGEHGLAAQVKEFNALANDAEKDLEQAAKSATMANAAFSSAVSQLDAERTKLRAMNLEPGNSLTKIVEAPEAKAILLLNQATAKEELARANLMGQSSESLQGLVSQSVAVANKAAKLSAETPTTAVSTKKYAETAATNFADAARLADQARGGSGTGGGAIRWLALTLKSVALHGEATATNNPQTLKEAQAAAAAAREENPFLPLSALAGNPGESNGPTPPPPPPQ
jgi:5-deoxy-D-glucuronate isomerase